MGPVPTMIQRSGDVPAPAANSTIVVGRTDFCAIAIICVNLISILFGSRVKNLRFVDVRKMNVIRSLLIGIYINGISLLSGLVMISGAVSTWETLECKSSVMVCLVFYVGQKILTYLFLVERAHAVRGHQRTRWGDWIWVVGVLIIGLGFGAILAVAFVFPNFNVSKVGGKCSIGAPDVVTIPLLAFDVLINILLTALFIYLLIPSLRLRQTFVNFRPGNWFRRRNRATGQVAPNPNSLSIEHPHTPVQSARPMDKLLYKSCTGALLVLGPTIVNLSLLFHLHGSEQAWLCFTTCTLDVTWTIFVMHWMTVDPLELDASPRPALVNN